MVVGCVQAVTSKPPIAVPESSLSPLHATSTSSAPAASPGTEMSAVAVSSGASSVGSKVSTTSSPSREPDAEAPWIVTVVTLPLMNVKTMPWVEPSGAHSASAVSDGSTGC